ncbi:MAG: response regulator [Candidatus Sericytochromatia bacterium]|nr:response regulator [Candidatus Tanganyikabacteria bacterium]
MARILLVEDVEDNRDLARELLEEAGFEVVEAVNGLEALDLVKSEAFDMVLLDLSLPLVDGWETLRQMRASADLAKIPVVAVTAHVMAGDRERVLEAGFIGYIPKPISVGTFAQEVRAYLAALKR